MEIRPIGRIRSCFGSKFGVPRQPGLSPAAWGELRFEEEFRIAEAVRGLEGFSHVWLIFGFHLTVEEGWKPTVRPPRLGGNERVGVWASRSTYRPNGLGLSLARLEEVAEGPVLKLGGIDLVDGTPVYDVKPYLPYAEAVEGARGGYAEESPELLEVETEGAAGWDGLGERTKRLMREVLAQDPRPAVARRDEERVFGFGAAGREVKFRVSGGVCRVLEVRDDAGAGLAEEDRG